MKQLRTRNRHQQPTPKPRRPPLQPPLFIQHIKQKLQAPRTHINRRAHPQLGLRADPQREPGHTSPDSGCISRCQRLGQSRVAVAEWERFIRAEVRAETHEEAMEDAVQKDEEGEGEGESEAGGAEAGNPFASCMVSIIFTQYNGLHVVTW